MRDYQPLTHGSLFAGIGGFETAAKECEIATLWNCEIDPYCRLVLKARFPEAVQYGDIKKLDGGKIPPVSIITMGSPCQSFSVASASRLGLDGASGLFLEAVRVIREMREATRGQYPRYVVMENVPGIFSSKSRRGGEKSDFGVVLNEFVKLCGETVDVPEPANGKWLQAGAVLGDGYSLAWRVLCASKFGLAQRRKRMYLVVDLDGERAAQVLSEPEGERRDFTPGYLEGQGSAGNPPSGLGSVGFEPGALARKGGHAWSETTGCLRADMGDNQASVAVYDARGNGDGLLVSTITGDHNGHISDYTALAVERKTYGICSMASNSMLSDNPNSGIYEADTARTLDGSGGNACANQGGIIISEQRGAVSREPVCYQDIVKNLAATDYKFPNNQQISEGKAIVERVTFGNNGHGCWNCQTAALKASGGDMPGGENAVVENCHAVRRLMPVECLLLQGLPIDHLDDIHISGPSEADIDYWYGVWEENRAALGKTKKPRSRKQAAKWLMNPYSDANAYRAIGNSLAVPCALYVFRGIPNEVNCLSSTASLS